MEIKLNNFAAQWRLVREDALLALERVGASGWYVLGEEVRRFEQELSLVWGIPHAVGCGNGLDGLEIGLRAAGLHPGDRVLTSPLSAFATTLAIHRAGGVPVFVDVDGSGLIDLDLCAAALHRDRSINYLVPVHLYGHALDVNRLEDIQSRFGVVLVEDCAQSVGASSRGVPVGARGRVAVTSFYPTKNLGAMGDGGAILTSDEGLAVRARQLRDYGQSAKYIHSSVGMNSRLDEFQAAILRSAMLPRLGWFTKRRREIAQHFLSGIHNNAIALPESPPGSDSSWHIFPVQVRGERAQFTAHLDERGIGWAVHYPTLIPDQPAMSRIPWEARGDLSTGRNLAGSLVSLPIHPFLEGHEIEHVIEACNEWRQ